MKPDRQRRIRAVLQRLRFRTPRGDPRAITAAVVADYLADRRRDHAPKTVKEERGIIGVYCRFLVARGLLGADPTRDVPAPRTRRPVPHYLSADQIAQTLRAARELGCYAEVALAINAGLRLAELQRLRWADVDLAGRTLTVRAPKGDHDRVVPLTDSAAAALADQQSFSYGLIFVFPARQTWPGGWKYVAKARATSWWSRTMQALAGRVPGFAQLPKGCTGNGWHVLRHTFASRLVQAGVDVYRVASWLGHSDVRVTQQYAHLRPGWDAQIDKADVGLEGD